MSVTSAMTGLTFPGMMDEPGCTAGRMISPRPVLGPELKSLMSFAILISSIARDLSPPETSTKSAMLCVDSIRFVDPLRSRPVIFFSDSIVLSLYRGCVFIPVPTAVPPIPMIFSPSEAFCILSLALETARA